tara:strand:- start:3110 stop:3559 length:450 start_codon:yes stop_codon:yes gene_type:complete
MNINKVFLFLIIVLFQIISLNSVSYADEDVKKENQEKEINLDEEELPAIDPFQSSSAVTSGASQDGSLQSNPDLGILSGFKLVGVIMGETKKIAVLASNEGYAIKFEENEKINENIELQEIYSDHLLIKDLDEKFYEVYMNDIIKTVDN